MFWFNYQPPNNNRRRGGLSYGFPWLFICFFWIAPHFWWAFVVFALAAFLVMAVRRSDPNRFKWSQQQPYQSNLYYTPSQQQPQANQYYTPPQQPQQPYYEPYEGGYRTEERAVDEQRNAGVYYAPAPEQRQEDPYQDYDQPKAEYPQQLPPM